MKVARIALAAVTLFACGGDDEDVSPAADNFSRGEYTVPVDAALAHVATTSVEKVFLRNQTDGSYRLGYKLPRVLAGFEKRVELVGGKNDKDELELSGAAGTAKCTRAGDGMMTCHEHLTGVAVDLTQVGQALDEQGIQGQERDAYLEVARRFSIDPLGVLTFPDPR